MTKLAADTAPHPLGQLLRLWRDRRGKSQLALSLDAGISQRHISFIESGRSIASRQVVLELAQALDIPLRERNALLLAAGYAPVYADAAWNAPEMHAIHKALARMLRQHDPFPAVVMDRYWNVLMANDAAPRFFGAFIDMAARQGRRNILRLMFDPDGMRPFIADWPRTAQALCRRVLRESVGGVIDQDSRALLDELRACPGMADAGKADGVDPGDASAFPVIPLGFIKNGQVLNYFSMVSTVGTPLTVAAQELRVECMFPADDATEAAHPLLMAGAMERAA